MGIGIIRVATCQFAVGPNPRRNGAQIRRQIAQAKSAGADVAHFPEAALSGYPGADLKSWDGYDWGVLRDEIARTMETAARLGIWVILGSAHRLTPPLPPHNSLFAIDDTGRIVERYDKCFCTSSDLQNFSCGDHLSVVTINGVRCGLLVCYDVRFPEIYREYVKLGAQCLFHSFHNARAKGPGILTIIMRPTIQAHAAMNYLWTSANNSSARYGSWPSVFVRCDGTIVASLEFNRAGVMVNTVDTTKDYYDASRAFRDRAIAGILRSGEPVTDPRSADRTCL